MRNLNIILLTLLLAPSANAGSRCDRLEKDKQDEQERSGNWRVPYLGEASARSMESEWHRIAREERRLYEQACEAEKLGAKPGARIGMTPKRVIEGTSWGSPDKVNRTTTAKGTVEQWVYPDGYLYFTNGRLSAIQN